MANFKESPASIKVAMAQLNIDPGHPHENVKRAMRLIDISRDEGADIVLLPEMTISGYMVSDQFEDPAYIRDCMAASKELQEYGKGIHLVWGDVVADFRHGNPNSAENKYNPLARGNDGRLLRYNAAHVASDRNPTSTVRSLPRHNGESVYPLEGMTIKTNEPLYNQFEDQRHMLPLKELAQRLGKPIEEFLQPFLMKVNGKSVKVGVLICEDIWVGDYFYNGKLLNPARILRDNGADLLVAISASPAADGKSAVRVRNLNNLMDDLSSTGEKRILPIVSVNNVGTQDNGKDIYIFDGGSIFTSVNKGSAHKRAPFREEDVTTVDVDVSPAFTYETHDEKPIAKSERRQEMHDNLVYGLSEFCLRSKIKRIVIGLSGGIDSAVVASLCAEALGKENVLAVNMPTKFNDALTKKSARATASALGIDYKVVPIEDSANNMRNLIKNVDWFGDKGAYSEQVFMPGVDVTTQAAARLVDENIQARIRMQVLSGIASKFRAAYTNNGNKSEVLQGYLTLDGDGRGFLQVIGDLFKTDVVDLATDINLRAIKAGKPQPIPWGLIKPMFDGERYYDSWDGSESPIPRDTFAIVASAELSAEQAVAQGKGDPIHFIYHDNLFRSWSENRHNIEDVLDVLSSKGLGGIKKFLGLTEHAMQNTFGSYFPTPEAFVEDLEKRWKSYHQGTIFKQIQSPPVIAVSKRPEGYDHRRSQNSANLTARYLELKEQVLKQNDWIFWRS